MACPTCGSNDIIAHRRQRAFYPLGPVAILGLPFAMFHQVSEARQFHCEACGHQFRRRTVIGWIALVCLFCVIAMIAVSIIGCLWRWPPAAASDPIWTLAQTSL